MNLMPRNRTDSGTQVHGLSQAANTCPPCIICACAHRIAFKVLDVRAFGSPGERSIRSIHRSGVAIALRKEAITVLSDSTNYAAGMQSACGTNPPLPDCLRMDGIARFPLPSRPARVYTPFVHARVCARAQQGTQRYVLGDTPGTKYRATSRRNARELTSHEEVSFLSFQPSFLPPRRTALLLAHRSLSLLDVSSRLTLVRWCVQVFPPPSLSLSHTVHYSSHSSQRCTRRNTHAILFEPFA